MTVKDDPLIQILKMALQKGSKVYVLKTPLESEGKLGEGNHTILATLFLNLILF